MTCHILQYKCQ